MGEQSPEVRYEPCAVWAASSDPAAGACAMCGWLEEDHWLAELERRGVDRAAVARA